jgi:alanyl-tRNA synthetase
MKSRGHFEIVNSSLVPENDPTLLFVNSGMFPLVPFLLGETHPNGTRITNIQRCVRTEDLEEVGDATHFTAFEMIGNWSLNDYFKKDALEQTYEFFIEKLGIPAEKIYGSVFEGDEDAPKDDVSIGILTDIFKKYGVEPTVGAGNRIQLYPKSKNWWGLAGGGPCGTTSEIFFDTGKEKCSPDCHINCDCGKYVEIGNNVFMEFLNKDGNYLPLGRHNVDFGGGLERIAQVVQQVKSNFDIDIYRTIGNAVQKLAKEQNTKSERIIVDHIKSATWIIMDGVVPGRNEKEYVLRRIIRRAIRNGMSMGISAPFAREIGQVCIDQFAPIYPQLKEKQEQILSILEQEELKFRNTLKSGLAQVGKYIAQYNGKTFTNTEGESFTLFESFGYPPEMFLEELKNANIAVDTDAFWKNHAQKNAEHQDKSRTATKGLFKGGLADTSEASTFYHTLTHLLLASLRKVVGTHIYQKGSHNTPERLRFDFPNEEKLTPEQLSEIESLINEQIKKGLPVSWKEMPKEEALKLVPFAAFEDKYDDVVKVYTVGDESAPFSQELCFGPHVKNTADIKGTFKIAKHEKIGAGVFRIKGILVP